MMPIKITHGVSETLLLFIFSQLSNEMLMIT